MWRAYNAFVFEDKLEEPVFRITRDKRNFGKFVWRTSDGGARTCIYISGYLNRGNILTLRDTLLHEMVHQWQHQQGLKYNEHDETFTQWVPKIKEKCGISLHDSRSNCESDVA